MVKAFSVAIHRKGNEISGGLIDQKKHVFIVVTRIVY